MSITTHRSAEHGTYLATLEAQQRRVAGVLDGLDDVALRRPVLASGWSPLGLLHHLTAMHQFWFRDVLSDEHLDLPDDSGPDFGLDATVPTREVLRAYERETANARAVLASLELDAPPLWWPEATFGEWRLDTQREVAAHVVVELCTHAGHLDAAREQVDGATWSYLLGRLARPEERNGLI